MLKRLRVKNFALIEKLDLQFSPEFNVFTGETGAGKSIILGALNLLFGDRASSEIFREGEEELFVEGNFGIPGQDEDLLIRREMYRGGRSYVFINDKQVTLHTLKETTLHLAEIMGQHQHQNMLNPANHVDILDRFGNLEGSADRFKKLFDEWKSLKSDIEKLVNTRQELLQRADYLKFQLSEIESAKLGINEEEELIQERKILKNAATLKELSSTIYSILYDDDNSVYERVNQCRDYFNRLKEIDINLPVKHEDVENLAIITEELGKAAAAYGESIEDDPLRLYWIENRLAEIDGLKSKYGENVHTILEYAEKIKGEIDVSDNFDIRIRELNRELDSKTESLINSGLELDGLRQDSSEKLASQLKRSLSAMGMGKMNFVTRFFEPEIGYEIEYNGKQYSVNEVGLSQLEFFISPNPGEGLKPLRKIASGGEISRVMLATKTAIAEKDNIGLLIFDEVDTGIGGKVARMVGKL